MKKIIIILAFLLLLTGCTNINKSDITQLVNEIQTSKANLSNQYRKGYKYYLPTTLNTININNSNEILTNGKLKYYLYVDLISYYNKVNNNYNESANPYYSKNINYNNKNGYLEINSKNNKYLIEIMYNYAKIEVIVDKDNINNAITNSLILLSTITYNNDIIKNMMGEDVLNYSENTFSIFDTNNGESNFLEYIQKYGNYEGDTEDEENTVPDYDLIN